MVGCQAVEDSAPCGAPARQRNRRKAKDKIKVCWREGWNDVDMMIAGFEN